MTGILSGLTVVEFAGLGPAPFAAMMLADHGARVIRIARRGGGDPGGPDPLARGRACIGLDLKQPAAVGVVLRLLLHADGLIEGFRPGAMERLGLGPEPLMALNPKLVYGRATGWGQGGPLAQAAGHDINFTALAGTLHLAGTHEGGPVPVPGLVGDFGGGGLLLAFGMLAALLGVARGGAGQVVDAAASEGAALLATLMYGWRAQGRWNAERGSNVGDGAPHFYSPYRCADGRWIAIGAIEPAFYRQLLHKLGLDDPAHPDAAGFARQWDAAAWPAQKARLGAVFAQRTRDQWCALLEGSDACFAPVLDLDEAPRHPQHQARGAFVEVGGALQPAPAPRFGAAAPPVPTPTRADGADTRAVLGAIGYGSAQIETLVASGAAWET